MRIPVSVILKMLASHHTHQQILDAYPDLEPADIDEAIQYAAILTDERVLATA